MIVLEQTQYKSDATAAALCILLLLDPGHFVNAYVFRLEPLPGDFLEIRQIDLHLTRLNPEFSPWISGPPESTPSGIIASNRTLKQKFWQWVSVISTDSYFGVTPPVIRRMLTLLGLFPSHPTSAQAPGGRNVSKSGNTTAATVPAE
jgi:hypothetical protein